MLVTLAPEQVPAGFIAELDGLRGIAILLHQVQGITVAAGFGLQARGERGDLTGVWVGDAKLGAIGMRVSRGVTSHGFALNCATDLAFFNAIVPCGMPGKAACSLSSLLGRPVPVAEVLPAVERHLAERLGRTPIPVDPATLELPAEDYDPETVHA